MDDQVTPTTLVKTIQENHGLKIKTAVGLYNAKYEKRNNLLSPWLKERTLTLVHAPTGVGKSWFAWAIAMAMASGSEFASWTPDGVKKVLIIDGEMQSEDLQSRLKQLIKLNELTDSEKENLKHNFYLLSRQDQDIGNDREFPDLNNSDDQDDLLLLIREIGPDLVVLDNLSTLADLDDENSASSYDGIFRFLTNLKKERAVMLIHHDRKRTTKNTIDGYRGSSKLAAIFEYIIHLSHVEDHNKQNPRGANFYMEFKKYRYLNDSTLQRRLFSLHPENGWQIGEDEEDIHNQVAAAVKAAKFISQEELAHHFGRENKSWASRKIKECVAKGLLATFDWKNKKDKAVEYRDTANMTDDELEAWMKEIESDDSDESSTFD